MGKIHKIYYYKEYPNRPNGYVGGTTNLDQRHYHHNWSNGNILSYPIVLDSTNDEYEAERLEKRYKKKYKCEDNRDSYTRTLAMQRKSQSVTAKKKKGNSIRAIQKGKPREGLMKYVRNKRRPIVQYKDGIAVKIWESASECRDITGIGLSCIGAVMKGRQKTAKGYTFEYL